MNYVSEPLSTAEAVRFHGKSWEGVYHRGIPGHARVYDDERTEIWRVRRIGAAP